MKAIACELPAALEVPLSRLYVPDIKAEVIRRGIVATNSESTIWRWLDHDAIRPWTFCSWVFPRGPDFEAKAGRVLDLYGRGVREKDAARRRVRVRVELPPHVLLGVVDGLELPRRPV